MKKLFVMTAAVCAAFGIFGQGPDGEMVLVQKELEGFAKSKMADAVVYTVSAEQLGLKCEGNQRVKIRLGETKNVRKIAVDDKEFKAKGDAPYAFDVTGELIDPNSFPPLVKDFELKIFTTLPKEGEKAPGQPAGPVDVAVVFKMGE